MVEQGHDIWYVKTLKIPAFFLRAKTSVSLQNFHLNPKALGGVDSLSIHNEGGKSFPKDCENQSWESWDSTWGLFLLTFLWFFFFKGQLEY